MAINNFKFIQDHSNDYLTDQSRVTGSPLKVTRNHVVQ